MHRRYKLFNVSKETFMNYDKPLTELQQIKKRNFRFLDSSIFGVVLSKDASMERFKIRIRKELYKIWPLLITFNLFFFIYLKVTLSFQGLEI